MSHVQDKSRTRTTNLYRQATLYAYRQANTELRKFHAWILVTTLDPPQLVPKN